MASKDSEVEPAIHCLSDASSEDAGIFFFFLVGDREGHITKDQEQKFRGLYIDITLGNQFGSKY